MSEQDASTSTGQQSDDTATGADNAATDTSTTSDTDKDSALGDPGKAALAAERKRAAAAERDLKAAQARLKEIEERDLSATEKAQRELATAKAEAESARAESLRLKVGLANGIPAEHLHRLHGSTEDELAADAKELAKLLTPKAPRPDPSQGARTDASRSLDMNALIRQAAGR